MSTTTHIHVRGTRDRLIDLLGIGLTYPLRDLAVRDEQLTVAFNTAAKIPIEKSQPGVLYQLVFDGDVVERTVNEKQTGLPIRAQGNGETIFLETDRIQEDITFAMFVKKIKYNLLNFNVLHKTYKSYVFPRKFNWDLIWDLVWDLFGIYLGSSGICMPVHGSGTRLKKVGFSLSS